MLGIVAAFQQLSCRQMKYNAFIQNLDRCIAFSDNIDFESRVFNVFSVSAGAQKSMRFAKKEYASAFSFYNCNVSNLVINVDCQAEIDAHVVVVLDLGSNTFNHVNIFGQCAKAKKFNYMLYSMSLNADRSVWNNVTTGVLSSDAELESQVAVFSFKNVTVYRQKNHTFKQIIADANSVAKQYVLNRYYQNETFMPETRFIFADNGILACPFPYQATNSLCIKDDKFKIVNRTQEFFPQSYYMEQDDFFTFNVANQTLFRCKDNYVFFYGICIPGCPSDMVNYTGFCVYFCSDDFVAYLGVCIPECPPWERREGDVCAPLDYDIKNTLRCIRNDAPPPLRTIADADAYLARNPDKQHCKGFLYKYYVQSYDIEQICDPPLGWIFGRCREGCQSGYFRHTESNQCLETSTCLVVFDGKCLDSCPRGLTEDGRGSCTSYILAKLMPWYLFRDHKPQGPPLLMDDEYARANCQHKLEASHCVQNCSPGYFLIQKERLCVSACPAYADMDTMRCVDQCASEQYLMGKKCYTACPPGTFFNNFSLTCHDDCKPELVQNNSCVWQCASSFYNFSYYCVLNCPFYMLASPITRNCTISCGPNEIIVGGRFCMTESDFYADFFDQTERNCAEGFYDDIYERQCVLECPDGRLHYKHFCTDRCLGYFKHGRHCVASCPDPLLHDIQTKSCVSACSPYAYYNTYKRACQQSCPDSQFSTHDNQCFRTCPEPLFGDFELRHCVTACDVFADVATRACVRQCRPPLYGDAGTKMCVERCPAGLVADQLSRNCVGSCPEGFLTDVVHGNCTTSCPRPLLQKGRECVRWCGGDGYADFGSFVCIEKCIGTVFGGACFGLGYKPAPGEGDKIDVRNAPRQRRDGTIELNVSNYIYYTFTIVNDTPCGAAPSEHCSHVGPLGAWKRITASPKPKFWRSEMWDFVVAVGLAVFLLLVCVV